MEQGENHGMLDLVEFCCILEYVFVGIGSGHGIY